MLHRVRSLVVVLSMWVPALAAAQPARRPPPNRPPPPAYTYCDAKMLSVLWKTSVGDAKATIQAKVRANSTATLDTEIARARQNAWKDRRARCNWDEAGLSYADVEKLARVWQTSVSDAKVIIEEKILHGGVELLRQAIAGAGAVAEDPTSTFLRQDKYTYCDVMVLSAYWRTSHSDAKARIGTKIQAGADDYLRAELQTGWRKTPQRCTYADGGFSFDDVKKLAKLWNISLSESKATIERKLRSGNSIYLRQEIDGSSGSETDAYYDAFHAQDKYTYCDAKMIGALWGQSVSEGKLAIGAKLATKNRRALDKVVTQARRNALRNEEARCSFYDAGFSYDDAVVLAKAWRVTPSDVKAMVPKRIAQNQERQIRATLAKARRRSR